MTKLLPSIFLGADHGGFDLKEKIKTRLLAQGFTVEDLGNLELDPDDDYPPYALAVAEKVTAGSRETPPPRGLLFCRSGNGMEIAANKVAGARAVTAPDPQTARVARADNDANIISLSGDKQPEELAWEAVRAFLSTEFSSLERHKRRLAEISGFEHPRVQVIPGILEKDFESIKAKIRRVENLVPWIQIDFTDGRLVESTSFLDTSRFGEISTPAKLEAHLMVANPTELVKPLTSAGFKRLLAHVEAQNIDDFTNLCRDRGIEVGLALDLPTAVDRLTPWLEKVDVALIMTIKAGFSGQKFAPAALEKINLLHRKFPGLPLEVDGGIDETTAPPVVAAGATRLISTSTIFSSKDIPATIEKLTGTKGDIYAD